MDKIEQEIVNIAENMKKATETEKEKLFSIIKSLGKDGLKARLSILSEDDKLVLKSALEEMTLKKAISMDSGATSAHPVQGKVVDTIIQEEKADDDADEKLMMPEAAHFDHQGTPTDGWQGQIIKALEIPDTEFEAIVAPFADLVSEYPDDFEKAYEGFKKLKGELGRKKGVSDPGALAAAIGRKKYGKGKFQHAAAEGKKMKKSEEFWNEVVKSDELLSDVVCKMMDKCGDSGMVMDKLAKKGADKKKVQGALDSYKMKKSEDPKKKLIEMEEKEHGTKNPKKLLEAEKKEKMKKAIEKTFSKAMKKAIKKAEKVMDSFSPNPEVNQLGDAPDLEVGGKNRSGVKKEDVEALDLAEDSKDAQEEVNDLKQGQNEKMSKALDKDKSKQEKEDREKAPSDGKSEEIEDKKDKKMKKSVSWEGQDRLLKANTLGRNFNFNVEHFIDDTLKHDGQTQNIKKSETKKEDLNDIIEKSMDRNWDELATEHALAAQAGQVTGHRQTTFTEAEMAAAMGLSLDEAKKIIG